MLVKEDIHLLEEGLSFWDNLSDQQKEKLIYNSKRFHYEPSASIHCGENDCIGVILVKKGTVRTYILSEAGKEITLYRLHPLEVCVLSASCILDSITFDVHMDAETSCDIIQINSATYSQLQRENIYVDNFTYRIITERFSDVMWAMQQILFMSFDKRLAAFLIDESLNTNSNIINLTHEQIAKYIGSAREVVSRMLKYFANEGWVTLSRGGIEIIDKKKLRSILR